MPWYSNLIVSFVVSVAMTVADFLNKFTEWWFSELPSLLIVLTIAAVFSIVFLGAIRLKIPKLLTYPYVNYADMIVADILLVDVFYSCSMYFLGLDTSYKWIIVVVVFCVCFRILSYRKKNTENANHNVSEEGKTLYDLKDLYDGNFAERKDDKAPIYVNEKDAKYDLLRRDMIVNRLHQCVTQSKGEDTYVVGLEGEWGSGKSTVINLLKKKLSEENEKENFITVDFDPWCFGSEEAMLSAMYDILVDGTGATIEPWIYKKYIKELSKIAIDASKNGSLLKSLFKNTKTPIVKDYQKVKDTIALWIKNGGKRVVFIIDNLDRTNSSNIILLIKLIGTAFKIPGVTYILAYDRERLNEILKKNEDINPKYIEKIIQQEIKMPSISEEIKRELIAACIGNVIQEYGIAAETLTDYSDVYNFICKKTDNLRSFKRLINSAFSATFSIAGNINKVELLFMECIRYYNSDLYELIRRNKRFFICCDRTHDWEYPIDQIDLSSLKEDGQVFFDQNFGDKQPYERYCTTILKIFPHLKNYQKKSNTTDGLAADEATYKEIITKCSIRSGNYFDLYFSYNGTNSSRIRENVLSIVETVKSGVKDKAIHDIILKEVCTLNAEDQRTWFEVLHQFKEAIPEKDCVVVAKAIFDNLPLIEDNSEFLRLSAKRRAHLIIETLLEKCSIEDFKLFLESNMNAYGLLNSIRGIKYWFVYSCKRNPENADLKNKFEIFQNSYQQICEDIMKNNINLYSDEYYSQHNIWGICDVYRQEDGDEIDEKVKQYLGTCFEEKYVYRILADAVQCYVGSGFRYELDEDNIKNLNINLAKVDIAISNYPPKTDSERFIFEVYQLYRSGNIDFLGHRGKNVSEQIQFVL